MSISDSRVNKQKKKTQVENKKDQDFILPNFW